MNKVIGFLVVISIISAILWVLLSDSRIVAQIVALKERTGGIIYTPTPTIKPVYVKPSDSTKSTDDTSIPKTKGGIPIVQETPKGNIVMYTKQGFVPAILRVVVGTVVRFEAVDATGMQIMSDLHPEHSILPDLSQSQEGKSFEYAFKRVGTWTYHSEDNPNITGTVIVLEK